MHPLAQSVKDRRITGQIIAAVQTATLQKQDTLPPVQHKELHVNDQSLQNEEFFLNYQQFLPFVPFVIFTLVTHNFVRECYIIYA